MTQCFPLLRRVHTLNEFRFLAKEAQVCHNHHPLRSPPQQRRFPGAPRLPQETLGSRAGRSVGLMGLNNRWPTVDNVVPPCHMLKDASKIRRSQDASPLFVLPKWAGNSSLFGVGATLCVIDSLGGPLGFSFIVSRVIILAPRGVGCCLSSPRRMLLFLSGLKGR